VYIVLPGIWRITDLAAPFPMTFAGVSRHVGVLESAGLVQRVVRGREHWLSIRPEGRSAAEGWIREQTAFWSVRQTHWPAAWRGGRLPVT
jgi:DNA-binding MarR family transcriptional regulator